MGGYVPIDQSDIPESRHAIFIRGFPANMLTDRIRDFFNDQVGHCAFDFVKQSPDGSKLFVALRFDEKDAARDCMERFNETNVLGHRVSFQWYRDVRRYVSYHQKRGSLPPPPPIRSRGGRFMPYRGRGSFPHSYGDSNFSRGRGFYNRGRPPLLQHRHDSYNRPRMRSPRHRSRTRSRSPAPSDLSTPRTRSVDRTPQSQRGGRDSPEHRSPSPEVAKKAKKQKKHKKKARNNSESPDDVSDSDIRSPNSKRRRESSEDREDREDREERDTPSPRSSPPPSHASQLMKNANEDTLESRRRQLMEKTGSTGMQLSSKVVAVGDQSQSLQSKALSIRMTLLPDSPEDASFSSSAAPTVLTEPIRSAERQVVLLPPGRSPDTNLQLSSVVISKENRNTKILNPIQLFLASMKNIQNTIISDIESEVEEIKKSAPPVKKESGLKLSAVTKQGLVEAQRKQKTAKLSPAQMQMVNAKQKDMDMSYELYCDTFASVLKILTDNDAELATLTEPAKNGVLADHKQQLSEELDEFIELLGQN